jgi:hypothetical protein
VCGQRVGVKSRRCPHGRRAGAEVDPGLDGDGRVERSGLGRIRRWCRHPARCWCCVPTTSVMLSPHGRSAWPRGRGQGSGSQPADQLLHLHRPIHTGVVKRPSGWIEQGHRCLPSAVVGILGSVDQPSSVRSSTVAARAPLVHDQIRVWPARQTGTDVVNVPFAFWTGR